MSNPPTEQEVAHALDVLSRAHKVRKPTSAAELAAMTDEEVRASGITSDEMFRLPGTGIPEAQR